MLAGQALCCAMLPFALIAGGCTMAGLGNYDIEECDPGAKTLEEDVCNRLNTEGGCMVYQCDSLTRHCEQSPRDADHDGYPTLDCGGTDCDDRDPTVHPGAAEVCDNKDNDCNGQVDEGFSWTDTQWNMRDIPIGAPCTVGQGACRNTGEVICATTRSTTCSAMELAKTSGFVDHRAPNGEWDWNCDGTIEEEEPAKIDGKCQKYSKYDSVTKKTIMMACEDFPGDSTCPTNGIRAGLWLGNAIEGGAICGVIGLPIHDCGQPVRIYNCAIIAGNCVSKCPDRTRPCVPDPYMTDATEACR